MGPSIQNSKLKNVQQKPTNIGIAKSLQNLHTNDSKKVNRRASFYNDKHNFMSFDETVNSFVGELGPGQVVSRQILASRNLGYLELKLQLKEQELEVMFYRARRLSYRHGSKNLPQV